MSPTPRELEITIKAETPTWLNSLNEYRSLQQSQVSTPPPSSTCAIDTVAIVKKTLFWSGVGAASSFISLLLGRLILDNTGYVLQPSDESLKYAAIGGASSYFIFKLIAEISKKLCSPALLKYFHSSIEEAENQEHPLEVSMQEIALYSLLLNLGGTFLGIVLLQNYQHIEKSTDDVIASTIGAGVLFASASLVNGLRRC
ncbi:MAG TPA: hypothetical protein DCZ80_04720 [Legionellales bacterium]|nr:hypothetical protein [Legionellales bacterium]